MRQMHPKEVNILDNTFDDGDLQPWTHEEMAAELTANSVQVP